MMNNKCAKVFIHHMWTDNINQLGLITYYCSVYKKVYFFAWIEVKELLEFYFKNITNLDIIYLYFNENDVDIKSYDTKYTDVDMLVHGQHDYLRNDIYKSAYINLNINDFDTNFVKFFYEGYGIPYIYRIEYFKLERNYELEDIRYNEFINEFGKDYILYHEIFDDNNIDSEYKNKTIINLNKKSNIFFDYIKILENALEIHLRDSSWAGICYHLDCKYNLFKNKKIYVYCHRYSKIGYITMFTEPIKLDNWVICVN